jgi:hypothetical protein
MKFIEDPFFRVLESYRGQHAIRKAVGQANVPTIKIPNADLRYRIASAAQSEFDYIEIGLTAAKAVLSRLEPLVLGSRRPQRPEAPRELDPACLAMVPSFSHGFLGKCAQRLTSA